MPRHPPVTASIVSLIFALAEIANRFQLKMRDVGQFVGQNPQSMAGPLALSALSMASAQLARPFGLEAYPAAGSRQRRISSWGSQWPVSGTPIFRLQRDKSKAELL